MVSFSSLLTTCQTNLPNVSELFSIHDNIPKPKQELLYLSTPKKVHPAANCNNFLRIHSLSPEQAFALPKLPLSLACCASFSDSIPIQQVGRSAPPVRQLSSVSRSEQTCVHVVDGPRALERPHSSKICVCTSVSCFNVKVCVRWGTWIQLPQPFLYQPPSARYRSSHFPRTP